MILIPPLPARYHKRRVPPAALTLVAAEFVPDGDLAYVQLTFDRPVGIAALDAAAVRVAEGPPGSGTLWAGAGAGTLVAPAVVRIDLSPFDPFAGPGTTLTATADTGIVADDDGGTWAGTTGTALPWPPPP
jgi:hypothetical protein